MTHISDRIIQRMKELGLRQAEIVEATGATKGAVSKWVAGTNTPTGSRLVQLANVLKTTENWLLTGVGLPEFSQVEAWDSSTPLDEDEVEIPFLKDFSFACGSGSIGVAMANEKHKLRISKSVLRNRSIERVNAVATIASGDSMSPTIRDGDTIHIDLGRKTIKDGKIFAICHGGLFMAKRLYNLPMGGIRIVSDNSVEYPEIQLSAKEVADQHFEIIGWIWQISSLESW